MFSKFLGTMKKTALVGATLAALPFAANAGLVLKLTDGVSTVTIADGGLGDSAAAAGVITYVGALGSANVNVTTGSSKPASGSAALPALALTDFSTVVTKKTDLTISLTDTDFTGPTSQVFLSSISKSDTSGNTYTLNTYLDDANAEFATTTSIASDLSVTGIGASSGSDLWTAGTVATAAYSLTMVVDLSLSAGTTAQFNSVLEVPEPAALSIFGLGLLGLAGLRRKASK